MAAQFSDDAFNKQLKGPGAGAGTLIGNWSEERVLRDSSGEGRSLPQRHLPRSGLLKDWTKVPPIPRKTDDTFDRVYGPKTILAIEPASRQIGKTDESIPKVMRVGPLATVLNAAYLEQAESEVQGEESILALEAKARSFETTTGTVHSKPDYTLAVKATGKKGYKDEILHGPAPDRLLAIGNEGLEVPTHFHYSKVEQVTHQRMCLADPVLRNNVQASAATGVGPFHRNSEFTKPMGHFTLGLIKDDAMDEMFSSLKKTSPLRHIGGVIALGGPAYAVPSLAAVKETIHLRLAEVWGPHCYVVLRQRLFDLSDHEGFVQKADVISVFRDQLGVTQELVSDRAMNVWLGQLITMKKDELKVGSFMTSLRPSLSQKDKRKVIETFQSLQQPSGMVRLGDWLSRLKDPELKQTIIVAFGSEDEESVSETAVTEQVFIELLSDLAPLTNIEPLLL